MKQKEIDLYLDWADRAAQLSYAERLKVGAVMVNGHNVVYGWNGTPRGWDNTCETDIIEFNCKGFGHPTNLVKTGTKTKPEVIHAEENVLLKCAHAGVPCSGGTLFITHAPCFNCATRIIQSGIKKVFYRNKYKNEDGVEALLKSNIEVIFLGEENALDNRRCEVEQGSILK